jgi:hypothetical protein
MYSDEGYDKLMRHPTKNTARGVDPKQEAGNKKTPLGLIPAPAMEEIAHVLKLGAKKYGEYNWRKTGVVTNTYVHAILRHLNAWRDGEDLDPESGRSHIAHIAAGCCILLDAYACDTLTDDRVKRPVTPDHP